VLKVGLVGLGFMGRGHLDVYLRLEDEGFPIKLVAICDVDPDKFKNKFLPGNIDVGNKKYDFSRYKLYSDYNEMFKKEELDYVDIVLPTYLHAEATVKALDKGMHVLCEKPMALNLQECQAMIDAAERNNKKLMIGHCLRFWPEYEYLKSVVEKGTFGKVLGGYFFRGGTTPKWSYKGWLLRKEKSGGALLDQHVHDIDTINWLFGMPKAVSTIGRNVIVGSGYDIVSTHYLYEDGKVITAEDDWVLNGDFGFDMRFRVNFEKGNIVYERGILKVNPNDAKSFIPDLPTDNGYYREIKYFANAILNDTPIDIAPPQSSKETIKIALAEMESADNNGKYIAL